MGTNFYLLPDLLPDGEADKTARKVHIGKRSSSGPFCLDCGLGIVPDSAEIHTHDSPYSACPGCGASFKASWGPGLGEGMRYQGSVVVSCSFTWAGLAKKWYLQQHPDATVIDEYGNTYTAEHFLNHELSHVYYEFIASGLFS